MLLLLSLLLSLLLLSRVSFSDSFLNAFFSFMSGLLADPKSNRGSPVSDVPDWKLFRHVWLQTVPSTHLLQALRKGSDDPWQCQGWCHLRGLSVWVSNISVFEFQSVKQLFVRTCALHIFICLNESLSFSWCWQNKKTSSLTHRGDMSFTTSYS